MGDQNAISLLRGINTSLQKILELQQSKNTPDNKKKEENDRRMTADLNKSGLSEKNITIDSAVKSLPINVADLSSLSGVPTAVKEIAALSGKTIKQFEVVMKSLINIISSYAALDKTTTEGLKSIQSLATGLDSLSKTHLMKLAITLGIVNSMGLAKSLEKFVTSISDSIKSSNFSEQDRKNIETLTTVINNLAKPVKQLSLMAPLMPVFALSAALMSPGLKLIGKSLKNLNDIKDPENAIKILHEMNNFVKSSTIIVASTIALGLAINKFGAKNILIGLGANLAILVSISGLAAATLALTGRSRRSRKALESISEFVGSLAISVGIITALSVYAGKQNEEIKKGLPLIGAIFLGVSVIAVSVAALTRKTRRGMRSMSGITSFAFGLIAVTGALVLLSTIVKNSNDTIKNSFILLTGLILATGALALVAAGVGLIMKTTKPLTHEVTKIALFGMALVVGTTLVGAFAKEAWPLIAYGLGATSAVIVAYGAAILIPALVLGATAKAGAPLMLEFMKIAAFGLAVTLGTVLVGAVIKEDIARSGGFLNSSIFYGTAGVSTLIIAYTAVINGATQIAGSFNAAGKVAMMDVMKLIALGLGITAATVVVGILMKNHLPETGLAFLGLTAIMTEALAIAQLSSLNKTALKKGIVDYKNVIILMGSGVLVLGAITGLGALIKQLGAGDFWKGFAYVSSVFGLMAATITGAVLLSRLSTRSSKTIINGSKSLLLAEGIILASEVILFGIIKLSKELETANAASIGMTFVLMTGIVGAAAGLASLARRRQQTIVQGATALLLAEGLILGSAVVLGAAVFLAKKMDEVGYGKVIATLTSMITIVGLSAALAFAASKLPKASILTGVATIGLIELLILGSALALGSIVNVTNKMKELGEGNIWKGFGQVNITLLTITELMVAFTGLAVAASFAAPFVATGLGAILIVEGFTLGVSLFTNTVIKLVEKSALLGDKESVDTGLENIQSALRGMREVAWTAGNPVSLAAWVLGSTGFLSMLPMILSMSTTASSLIAVKTKLHEAGIEDISELGSFARSLSAIFTYDNFKIGIGPIERVRLLAQYKDMGPVFTGLKKLASAISTLVSTIGGMDDNGNIIPIVGHDSTGLPIYGKSVDMAAVARNIVDAVKIFSEILSTDLAKLGNKENRDILKSFESLSTILEPISNFAIALASFEAGGPGKIRAIRFDENGKQVNTPYVDVVSVARTIGSSITAFVETLFGTESANKWIEVMSSGYEVIMDKRGKKVIGEKKSNAEIAMGVLSTILDPVSNFVDTLTRFQEGDSGTLVVPIYDNDGNISGTRKVNVENVARLIASAVSTFAKTLFGPGAANEWLNIITEGGRYIINEKKGEATYLESGTEKALGALGALITPVVAFANVLAMFGEAAEAGNLVVYTQDGKSHTVNVVTAASAIGTAIGSFVSNLNNKLDAESLNFLNTNSEVLSKVFSSFAESIQNISSIEAKDLDSKIDGISKVFDFIASKGTTETSLLVGQLQSILEGISSPLNDFVNTFIQISTNDLGTNVDKFSASIKTLNKTIQDTDALTGKVDVNKLSTFFTDLFGKSINEADLSGIDIIKSKFEDYESILKSISSLEVSDASFNSFISTATQFILFGTTLKQAADIISNSVEGITVFVTNRNKIVDFINLLSSDDINLRVNERQVISFSKSFKEFVLNILEIADAINTESLNVLDLNSKKILNFINDISNNFADKTKLKTEGLNEFKNSFKQFLNAIGLASKYNLTETSTNLVTIKNTFDEYSDTISNLNEIELLAATGNDEFNKSLESLFANILSMSDKNKVNSITNLQKTLTTTTTSLTKLDNAFIKKNNDRVKEINKLSESLKELSQRLGDSSTGLGKLIELVNALNRADEQKIKDVLGSIGSATTPKQGIRETIANVFKGGQGEEERTAVVNTGLSADEVMNAVAAGIAMAFEGAQIRVPQTSVTGDNNDKTIGEHYLQFDVINGSRMKWDTGENSNYY